MAYGFSSLLLALEICLQLRALELGNAWTAIIMDTRNGEDCYPLSGQRLWCDFTVKLLRRLPVLWQGNCHGNGFKGLTLRFDSHQEPSTTLVLAAVHFEVMCEKNVLFAVNIEFRTHEDRQGITSNGLVADPFSISCYVMPIRVILLVMDTFGAGAAHVFGLMWHCSRFQFSCSCIQCTCRNSSLYPSNYAGYV